MGKHRVEDDDTREFATPYQGRHIPDATTEEVATLLADLRESPWWQRRGNDDEATTENILRTEEPTQKRNRRRRWGLIATGVALTLLWLLGSFVTGTLAIGLLFELTS